MSAALGITSPSKWLPAELIDLTEWEAGWIKCLYKPRYRPIRVWYSVCDQWYHGPYEFSIACSCIQRELYLTLLYITSKLLDFAWLCYSYNYILSLFKDQLRLTTHSVKRRDYLSATCYFRCPCDDILSPVNDEICLTTHFLKRRNCSILFGLFIAHNYIIILWVMTQKCERK